MFFIAPLMMGRHTAAVLFVINSGRNLLICISIGSGASIEDGLPPI
jgi:hypothetical protein